MHFSDAMYLFWTALFLLICKGKSGDEPENITAVLEGTDERLPFYFPDFRCFKRALKDFQFSEHYPAIYYITHPIPIIPTSKIGCDVYMNFQADKQTKLFYPLITARDPMMPFYIDKLQEGVELTTADTEGGFVSGNTPLKRRKYYCASMKPIMSTFPEYWEAFEISSETCTKISELVTNCYIFRQAREIYKSLYEKLCLDEAGCYNIMEYYEELPRCVKHMAIHQFKNASVGSWHHSIINYCQLTTMLSGAKESKYEQSILKGKTKIDLTKMCLYLRHRLLPEEGKETEMPDPDELYEEDVTTTAQYGSGISEIATFWTITIVVVSGCT